MRIVRRRVGKRQLITFYAPQTGTISLLSSDFMDPPKKKAQEQHYGTLLKLYIPYQSDQELKRQRFPTYQSFYNNGCFRLPDFNKTDGPV
ncbi:hypothetical protein F2P81_021794 [Scophthalmus maximus]|uniref:Uncharacterized protein n=1 Tax=Scophthalmus maximus TaxID=52904 RepID=A0A6A4RSC3_SCOMX|nr:hypothetical protein F2P81_021794 [Scophthalmus maximus]